TTQPQSKNLLIPTWNDYFKLRKKRRMFELVAYPPSTILPIVATGSYCMNLQVDPTEIYLGLDPVTGLGLLTLSTKNRADARLHSIRNPVPDYYGEKIQSVADYRSWLRKQREHYRKGVFGGNVD
ncbi:mitochondrial import protein Pam17-domain-containing protein, partial [Spinellus fusiger]